MPDRRRPALRSLTRRSPPAADCVPGPDKAPPSAGRVVDNAVYVDGSRIAHPITLAETFQALRATERAMAWIGLYRPDRTQIASLAVEFELHELAVEDTVAAHQRPKLERYGSTLFVVLRPARYVDEREEVEFGEVHLFVGPDFVLSVRHSETPDLARVRARLEADPELLARGPEAVLYAILDEVVDGYLPVVAGLENDLDEIESEVFSGQPQVSRRIYELSQEVVEFQRATHPLQHMLAALQAGSAKYAVDVELQRYLRDVADHVTHVVERVDGFRQLLRDMLTVNATLVAQQQNEEMKSLALASQAQNGEVKKISAWGAILFAPTLIGTIYGMNFEQMPELSWAFGYPFALALMGATCLSLYLVFKRRDWL